MVDEPDQGKVKIRHRISHVMLKWNDEEGIVLARLYQQNMLEMGTNIRYMQYGPIKAT